MATGIQTGIRTGTGTVQTPRTGTSMKPGNPSMFGKLMQAWSKMEPRKKTLVIIIGVALLVGIVGLQMYTKASAYTLLYPQKLAPQDVQQISLRLNEMKIGFTTDGDKVMVSPADKARVQMQLASYGLPHKQVYTPPVDSGLSPKTADDKNWERTQLLQADVTEALRSIEGVADANVRLVTPVGNLFQDDGQPAKAAVMLWLQPGTKLTVSQIKGIVHYVAFSVEGLNPQSVKVVDQNGRILNDESIADEEGAGGLTANLPTRAIEKQVAFEKSLQDKVQKMLDDVLGPNKAQVSVSATLDFSQSETTSKTYGSITNPSGVVVAGEKINSERYTTNADESGTVQMGIPSGGSGSGKVNYNHKDVTRNFKVNEVSRRVVSNNPTVSRITASVAVDNLKPDQIGNIKSLVQGAIGYDASRGDVVNVASMPFSRSVFEGIAAEMSGGAPYAHTSRRQGTNSQQYLLYMALLPMAALLIVATLFFLKQRRVQVEKSSLILSSSPSTTVSDISDLLSDKMGHTASAPQMTKVNTTEQLEKLAKEKPTKVAELLKSTWLADKER
ncbi:MAG: flagellar basal-body MS-ring/collar protein FliF [bacterium]